MSEAHRPVVAVNSPAHPDSPTAGIQEAVDSLPQGGGVVFVPRGTYRVRRSVTLRANVTLRGEGAATVLMRPAPLFFELAATTPPGGTEVKLASTQGLQVGDEIYITDPGQGGWHARHMAVSAIEGTRVHGTLVAGDAKRTYGPETGAWAGNFFPMLFIPGGDSATVADLMIDGGPVPFDPARMPGFTCSAVHGVGAENLRVRGVTVRRWPCDGISAQGGSAIVTECVVEDCLGHGYHPGSSIAHSIWTNNIGRRNGWDGLFFCKGVRNAVVSNNVFMDNGLSGIGNLSEPDAFNVVSGNVVARNGRHGIQAFEARGNAITGNVVRDNSQSEPGRYAGIWLESHSENVVTGNTCFDTQKTPTQTVGIETADPAGANLVAQNAGVVRDTPVARPVPRGEIRAATIAPVIDGKLDDAIWQAAEELSVALCVEEGDPAKVVTTARFLRDERFLYIGVHCPEPHMDRVRDSITERGGFAFGENCVEIYFMPDAGGERTCQIAVNSLGALFDTQYQGRNGRAWDSKAQAAAHRGKDFWSVEIAIPLESFAPEGLPVGRECKANIYRTRLTLSPMERSAWSPTRSAFLMPRRFGILTVK